MQNSDARVVVERNKVSMRDFLPSEQNKTSMAVDRTQKEGSATEQAIVPFTPSMSGSYAITQLPQRDTLEKQAIGDGVAGLSNITTAALGYAATVTHANSLVKVENSRARTAENNGERQLQLGLRAIAVESKKNKQEYKNNQIHEKNRHQEVLSTLAVEEDKNQKIFEDKKEKRAIEKDANAVERERLEIEKQKLALEERKFEASMVDHMVRKNGPAFFSEKRGSSDQEDTLESSSEKGFCVIC